MTDNGVFCMMPWVHTHFWPNGNAYPCCLSDSSIVMGNANHSSISDIWNGQPMRDLRRNMLDGLPSKACARCYDLEQAGMQTLRQQSNIDYAHHAGTVDSTLPDGTVPQVNMAYLDVRFSNICNLRCRTCGPELSSGWYDDTLKLREGYDLPRIMNINRTGDFWDQLLPLLDHTEEVYFAGGESLLTEEHYRILDHWIATGHTSVRIRYTTNFTVLDYKQRDLFELWRHFPDIKISASLDGSHARAEYLRKNMVWSAVVANRQRMIAELPHMQFHITPTVSLMNVWHLPDFQREWVELGLIGVDDIRINVLTRPEHSSTKVLPSWLKKPAELRIRAHMDWLCQRHAAADTLAQWQSVITFMTSGDDHRLVTDFLKHHSSIDSLRSESLFDVFPEIKTIADSTWCALPWTNINTTPQGQVKLCCNITHPRDVIQLDHRPADWSTDSLSDIWNGDHFRSVRDSMLNNQQVSHCAVCYRQEALGNISPRISANRQHAHLMASDLSNISALPTSFELRTSTRCNLRCTTCWAGSSDQIHRQHQQSLEWDALPHTDAWFLRMPSWLRHSWQQEADMVTATDHNYVSKPHSIDNFRSLAATLRKLYVTGGEPTMDANIHRYLDMLLAAGNHSCHVSFTTNCTLWNPKLMSRMAEFPHSEVQLSVDAHGIANDRIRQGSHWHEVTDTVNRYLDSNLGTIKIYTVISAMNCLELEPLLEWMINTVNLHARPVTWSPIILESPGYQSLQSLPTEARLGAAASLEARFNHTDWPQHFCDYAEGLNHVLRALRDPTVTTDTEGWFKLRERLDYDDAVLRRLNGANSASWQSQLPALAAVMDQLHHAWPNTTVPRG